MTLYISKEKTGVEKIWEAELDKVCEEQQFLNLQDDLIQDLQDDIKKLKKRTILLNNVPLNRLKGHLAKGIKLLLTCIPEPGESLHDLKDAVLNDIVGLTKP